jgi:hypothetical protein
MPSNKKSAANLARRQNFLKTRLEGGWFSPKPNPPVVAENVWRYARLKINVAAAGDSGAIENITPAVIFEKLKAQQGIDITAALASVKITSVMSYALPGIADTGAQTYPSTKIRVYAPLETLAQGVLIAQKEDAGTLNSVARVGYRYSSPLAERVLAGSGTNYVVQIENYHCARGFIYIDCHWSANPN